MKKILLFLTCLVFASSANSQLIGRKKVQLEANDKLAYVYNYLKSDTMIFKNLILPDPNTKVVMMHDAYGDPLYVLMTNEVFDSTNAQIARLSNLGIVYGLEFNLTYLSAFSWQKRKAIKNINNKYQKAITKVFNTKVKYCLMQQGSRPVKGKRILDKDSPNYGQIIPDFSVSTSDVAPSANTTPIVMPVENMKEVKKPAPAEEKPKPEPEKKVWPTTGKG